MQANQLINDMEYLETAEDFLNYFEVDYEPMLIQNKRVQLLRLYQQLLEKNAQNPTYATYRQALCTAYKQLSLGRELAFSGAGCQGCRSCDDELES
jgi:nitrogenase-stabilizing/protective protein